MTPGEVIPAAGEITLRLFLDGAAVLVDGNGIKREQTRLSDVFRVNGYGFGHLLSGG